MINTANLNHDATNQAKVLTLDETLDFHIYLAGKNGTVFYVLDKAMKNDLIENNLEEVNDQTQVHTSEG